MKSSLKALNIDTILEKRVFFLYGNHSELIAALPDIFLNILIENGYIGKTLSCSDYLKNEAEQQGLFNTQQVIYSVTNVQDSNYSELLEKISGNLNDIFLLVAGDYRKSKIATDFMLQSREVFAIPLFKTSTNIYNELISFCFPGLSPADYDIIKNVLEISSDDLASTIRKIYLLDKNYDVLKDYTSDKKQHFLEQFDPIPLLRYLSAIYAKDPEMAKLAVDIQKPTDRQFKHLMYKFVTSELKIKNKKDITNSDILNILFLTK